MIRPDSDDQPCYEWTPGRPGDGVMVFPVRDWITWPATFRADERGRPVEHFGQTTNGIYYITTRADIPMLRGRAVMGGCQGDGHYMCRRCIFWRDPWPEHGRYPEELQERLHAEDCR